jgi:hypothetical protein
MTAGPSSPGVGPPLYHPAGKPPVGTCIDPSLRRPRLIKVVSTPMEAICRRTGVDRLSTPSWAAEAVLELAPEEAAARGVAETDGGAAEPV